MNTKTKLEDLKNYLVQLKVTDRSMKPQKLHGTNTGQRINWKENVTIIGAENESSAKMAARLELTKNWPSYIILIWVEIQKNSRN